MGLDITAYSMLKRLPEKEQERIRAIENCEIEGEYNWTEIHNLWQGAFGAEAGDGLKPGYYAETFESRKHTFRAGSYSGYNHWRDFLSVCMFGVPAVVVWANESEFVDLPFYELIRFSDCEGTIGPATSAKLAADFEAYAKHAAEFAKAKLCDDESEWWLSRYADWQKAFALASDGGAVNFH